MALAFCRLDRPGGSGLALEQSLAGWLFVAFRSCFWAGIVEKAQRPNQSMKPTQPFVVSFGSMRTLIFKGLGGLSLSR